MVRNIVAICLTAAGISFSAPDASAEPKLNPGNNHWYDIITADSTAANYWQDIEQKAASAGSHLSTINDLNEQKWIFTNIVTGTFRNYWIGLNDASTEGALTWADGGNSTYTNWNSSWDNTSARDYCYIRQSDGQWNLSAKNDYKLGITEWPASTAPEPVSSSLLISGGLMMLIRAYRKKR